jgi:CheY-like chemotaxis protein
MLSTTCRIVKPSPDFLLRRRRSAKLAQVRPESGRSHLQARSSPGLLRVSHRLEAPSLSMVEASAGQPGRSPVSVLVADGDANRRLAVIAMLARGIDVAEARDAYQAVRLARRRRPDVLLLASSLRGLRTTEVLVRLRRHAATREAAVIVTCPDDSTYADLQPHLTPGVSELLLLPTTPILLHGKINDALARAVGDHGSLAELGARFAQATATGTIDTICGPTAASVVSPNPILLKRAVQCPVCAHRSRLFRYDLRQGMLEVRRDRFDVPHYVGPRAGRGTYCNMHLLHVTLCPSCFFASGHSDLFLLTEEDHPDHEPMDDATREALLADADRRGQLMWSFRDAFFTEQRKPSEALIAYQLAEMSSRVMHTANPQTYLGELSRMAQYHLRAAQLALWDVRSRPVPFHIDESRPLPPKAAEQVEGAFEHLLEACDALTGPGLDQSLYQLVAVSLAINDATTAEHALGDLRRRFEQVPEDASGFAPLQDYLMRAEKLWRDRDAPPGQAAA